MSVVQFYKPLVCIVIPAFNEEEDIGKCLQAIQNLDYEKLEVIVVDDGSTDDTIDVASKFRDKLPLRLMEHERNKGVAAARNTGIKAANGEITVILNADVLLPFDFISRILKHYKNGADFVVCRSRVLSDSVAIPAYIQALDDLEYAHRNDLVWSEGFSCRKKLAEDVGLFDERFPEASGEDVVFGHKMDKTGKKVLDKSIQVPHIAPSNLKGFIKQRIGRGKGAALAEKYYWEKSTGKYLITILSLIIGSAFLISKYPLLIIPLVITFVVFICYQGYKLSKVRERYHRYFLHFSFLRAVEFFSYGIGYIKGLIKGV